MALVLFFHLIDMVSCYLILPIIIFDSAVILQCICCLVFNCILLLE